MRAVIQAVSSASVRVNGGEPRAIGPGLMILLGVRDTDSLDIVPKLADKCAGLRIFPDAEGKLNLSAKDLGYSALVVSQFTLYGDTKKGYRPSFIKAAKPPLSVDAYELFLAEMNKQGLKDVQHGEFGADMQVALVNEGPCTNQNDSRGGQQLCSGIIALAQQHLPPLGHQLIGLLAHHSGHV